MFIVFNFILINGLKLRHIILSDILSIIIYLTIKILTNPESGYLKILTNPES